MLRIDHVRAGFHAFSQDWNWRRLPAYWRGLLVKDLRFTRTPQVLDDPDASLPSRVVDKVLSCLFAEGGTRHGTSKHSIDDLSI